MSTNIGNNEAEQFNSYRKTIDGTDEKGNTIDSDNLPEDITPDEDDLDDMDTEDDVEDIVEEEEFKKEVNTNFPLSGGGTPLIDTTEI